MTDPNNKQIVPEYLRGGRFRHLEAVLDEEPPWILRKVIPLLSARVRIDDYALRKLQDLARDSAIVYAMKYRSIYDLHFLRMRFADLGLPVPSFIFDASASTTGSFSKIFKVWQTKVIYFAERAQAR